MVGVWVYCDGGFVCLLLVVYYFVVDVVFWCVLIEDFEIVCVVVV